MLKRGDIMNIKKFEAEYSYDYELDVVNIEINREYVHKKSIDLDFGVFLDFDENNLPVNLEIVSASKRIGIEKKCLINPDGNVNITISDHLIEVEVTFVFEKEYESVQLTALNGFGFPNSETNFALV